MVYRGLTLVVMFLVSLPGDATESSAITRFLEPYPRSELLEHSERADNETFRIPLGAPKRTGGVVGPETSEIVVGKRTATTWFVPNEQRTQVVYDFFKEQIARRGTILFECSGLSCGSSNYWANTVFERSILFGLDQEQRHLLVRIDEDSTWYLSIYVVLRGTRALHAHVDLIVAAPKAKVVAVDENTIIAALRRSARFAMGANEIATALPKVVDALKLEPSFRIAVVGHASLSAGESVTDAISRSERSAQDVRNRMIAAGISPARLEAYGVGPLSPINSMLDRVEIVLINRAEVR